MTKILRSQEGRLQQDGNNLSALGPSAWKTLEVLEEEKLFKLGAFGVHDPVVL